MLYSLGSVSFEKLPTGLQEVSHAGTGDFATHPVLGDVPPLEWVGPGQEVWSFKGVLLTAFSARTIGDSGLSQIDALHAMRTSGQAQFLMRGDGVPLGWVVVTKVSERSRMLLQNGVGEEIQVDISVKKTGAPSAQNAVEALFAILPPGSGF